MGEWSGCVAAAGNAKRDIFAWNQLYLNIPMNKFRGFMVLDDSGSPGSRSALTELQHPGRSRISTTLTSESL